MSSNPQPWPHDGPEDDLGPRPEDSLESAAGGPDSAGSGDPSDLESGIPWAPPPAWARGGRGVGLAAAADLAPGPPDGEPKEVPAWATPIVEAVAKPAQRPLWERALVQITQNRMLQVLLGLAVVAGIVVYALWPREAPGVMLSTLKRHPERYENQVVRVRGRVVEVFPLGASYAFNLVQGRDTIVVFTRYRTPRRGEKVEFMGSANSGVLDGMTRIAVFEEPPRP